MEIESFEYQEAPSITVGKYFMSKGFDLASRRRFASNSLVETDSLGVLRKNPEARYLFGIIKQRSRRIFFGMVRFSEKQRAVTKDWVFQVYGREHIKLARQLADEMASIFGVKIIVLLVSEQPKAEAYLSDYYDC